MFSSKKQKPTAPTTATAVGGKTARACDSCLCHRARWYCAADDAFLCENCDSSVHSANLLARRHHRVQLQANSASMSDKLAPAWHHGFKRKARTPRPSKARTGGAPLPPFVPEIEASAEDGENEEEQLLYRVPTFDPVLSEFCTPLLADETSSDAKPTVQLMDNSKPTNSNGNEFFAGFLQSDAELEEFEADMESLLGRGVNNDSFSMEELGLVDTKYSKENGQVKEELDNDTATADDNSNSGDMKLFEEIDLSDETLEINFDCRAGDEEQEEMPMTATDEMEAEEYQIKGKKLGLTLDYDAIAVEWSTTGSFSPWMNGKRPQLGRNECLLDYLVCNTLQYPHLVPIYICCYSSNCISNYFLVE